MNYVGIKMQLFSDIYKKYALSQRFTKPHSLVIYLVDLQDTEYAQSYDILQQTQQR